jgi:hypothetical protein
MKDLMTARIGLVAHWLAEAANRVVDWANRRLTPSGPSNEPPEPTPEALAELQAANRRMFGDAQSIFAEINPRLLPHTNLIYASAGITEDGVRFVREPLFVETPQGKRILLITHDLDDACNIVSTHL